MRVPTEEVCIADALSRQSTQKFILQAIAHHARSRGCRWCPEDIEDAAQEALLRLWANARTARPTRLTGYLRQCARNVVTDRVRHDYAAKRLKPEECDFPLEELLDTRVRRPDEQLESREELKRHFEDLRGALPPKMVKIALLVLGAGLTGAEAAARLGQSVSAIHSTLFRARTRLAETRGLRLAWRRARDGSCSHAHP